MLKPFLALSLLLWSAWSLPDFAAVLAAGLGVMPLAFFWAGCPCCGGTDPCLLDEDAFTRADSTTVGGQWTEVSGNWYIDGNTLVAEKVTPTPEYQILLNTESLPSGKGGIRATINVDSSDAVANSGATFQLIGAYTSSTTFLYANFYLTSTGMQISIYELVAGVLNQIGNDTFTEIDDAAYGTPRTISFCWTGSFCVARLEGNPGGLVRAATTMTGDAALSRAAAHAVYNIYDDVSIYKVFEQDSQCEECEIEPLECELCNGSPPDEIIVEISGMQDDIGCGTCENYDGTYVLTSAGSCDVPGAPASPDRTCCYSYGPIGGACSFLYLFAKFSYVSSTRTAEWRIHLVETNPDEEDAIQWLVEWDASERFSCQDALATRAASHNAAYTQSVCDASASTATVSV